MANSANKPSVQVRFISDDDVLEHIYSLSDIRENKKKGGRRKLSSKKSTKDEQRDDEGTREEVPVPVGLHVKDGSTTGRQMFSLDRTPSSKQGSKTTTDKMKTPTSSCSEKKDTPYKLRRKIKQKLSKMKADQVSSAESDSERSSEDEADKEDTEADLKNYFSLVSKARSKTSNHMLSKLGRPMPSMEEINQILSQATDPNIGQRNNLLQEHRRNFSKWMALLKEGFNLLLYGVGSKIKLMQNFKEDYLSNHACVTINGFNPGITTQEVVTTILRQVMREETLIPGLTNQVERIREHYSQKDTDELFLLVNNIDGSGLRHSKAQGLFTQLARSPRIHIIASVDHINASLLWDQEQMKTLSFVWINATTFEPYVLESSLEPLKNDASTTLGSLQHVFCSLTPNAKKIFLLIARYQIDHKDSPGYIGLSFQECYKRCREAFLVNSDLTLRTQLTEFLDHMLLKIKKGHDGTDNLIIPLDDGTLALFVQKQEDG
ncbi:origin recognition complex subunit 2-like [Ornithodoros turicata]|uniref:origin recognition complex subunit 2-like n=1 Tax=Ornithodoros turicata TaxID=34597 RepID=UPI003139EED2